MAARVSIGNKSNERKENKKKRRASVNWGRKKKNNRRGEVWGAEQNRG